MATLSKSNAKTLRASRKDAAPAVDFADLNDLPPAAPPPPQVTSAAPIAVDELRDTHVGPKNAGSGVSPAVINATIESKPATPSKGLSSLAKKYMFDALEKAAQPPSPKLRESAPDYAIELTRRSEMLQFAEAKVGLANAFTLVVQATAVAGAVNVYRLLSDIQRQVTWGATLDIQKDRKGRRSLRSDTVDADMYMRADEALRRQLGMVEATLETGHQDGLHHEFREPPVGLDPERDPDHTPDPTEHEILDALVEINAYLSVILRTVLPDPKDRAYVNADLGVPFTTRIDGEGDARSYHPVHDAAEAVEVQIAANRTAMERRRRQAAEAAVKANAALFAMLGSGRMPSSSDEPAF